MDIEVKHFDELTNRDLYEIMKLRSEVFVVEQDCVCLDLDGIDTRSWHVFIMDEDQCTACLRCFMDEEDKTLAHIGRVVTRARGQGQGGLILQKGIDFCLDHYGADRIYLEAQCYCLGYYEKYGFRVISDEITVDGIPHKKMLYSKNS